MPENWAGQQKLNLKVIVVEIFHSRTTLNYNIKMYYY